MRDGARSRLDAVLRRSPAQTALARKNRSATRILTYHVVGDGERFGRQLDHLQEHYVPVGLDRVLAAVHGGTRLPDRAALVTFDDGDRTLIDVALPELVARNIPAVAFVVAGVIDTKIPFWWVEAEQLFNAGGRVAGMPDGSSGGLITALKRVEDSRRLEALDELRESADSPAPLTEQLTTDDVLELERSGITIENHTMTHPCLDRCTTSKIEKEISESTDRLAAILGRRPEVFAYPNGNVDDRVVDALRRRGYTTAFLFDHNVTRFPVDDPFRISRVRVSGRATIDRLATILSGLHPAIHHSVGRA